MMVDSGGKLEKGQVMFLEGHRTEFDRAGTSEGWLLPGS
jgi:hypothetical protein